MYYQYYVQERVNVPSVVGEQYSDAAATLGKQGLKVKAEKVNNAAPENQVIAQSEPVNTAVTPGTVITLQVSTGTVELPDVHGKTFDDARAEINHAGFPVVHEASSTVTTTDKSKDGQVADEDPTPGNAYAPSTTITLKLYKYVPPQPTCTTPPPSSPSGPTGGPSSPSSGPSSSTGLPPCTTPVAACSARAVERKEHGSDEPSAPSGRARKEMLPPCARTRSRTMARPRPVPPDWRERLISTR